MRRRGKDGAGRDAAATAALAALAAFHPDFGQWRDDVLAELTQVYLDAYHHVAPDAPITGAVRARARQAAAQRVAQLLPDLAASTRDGIDALADDPEATSVGGIRGLLHHLSLFSTARATLIAATEVAIAWGAGQRQAARDTGREQKRWRTAHDEAVCDTCAANADDGWIGIDETFSGGDDDIPSHPACRCEVEYRGAAEKAAAAVLTVARCPRCHRKLGEHVNVGARLHCGRCRDVVEVVDAGSLLHA